MEIKTFDISLLEQTKKLLKDVFYNEHSNEEFNEWEFADYVMKSDGWLPEQCIIAVEGDEVIGYNILTAAEIGASKGLALGPLAVKNELQNNGIGTQLVNESIKRAKDAGCAWIALLGGDYYDRFGFENGKNYGITVTENEFDNDHIHILFLDDDAKSAAANGKLIYCSAFYDAEGNLL